MFNRNWPFLPPITKDKFRRIEANCMTQELVSEVLNQPSAAAVNKNPELNAQLHSETNFSSSIRIAEEDLGDQLVLNSEEPPTITRNY